MKSYGFGIKDLSKIRANGKKATHPCPCGYAGDKSGRCMCTADQVQRYRSKISGPLLDRIDLHVDVARPARLQYQKQGKQPEGSAAVRKRVIQARNRQLVRGGVSNAQLDNAGVRQHCQPDRRNRIFLEDAAELMNLSPRAY